MTAVPTQEPETPARPGLAGPLHQRFTLTLHTHYAQALFTGSGRHRSLLQFANAAFHLRMLTALDRPLAEACLLETERDLDGLHDDLTRRRDELEAMIRRSEAEGLALGVASSARPAVYDGGSFGSPYGYRALAVLFLFDKIALLFHTAYLAALMDNKARQEGVEAYSGRFRRIFENAIQRHDQLRRPALDLSAEQCASPEHAETLALARKALFLPELSPELIAGRIGPAWGLRRRPGSMSALDEALSPAEPLSELLPDPLPEPPPESGDETGEESP